MILEPITKEKRLEVFSVLAGFCLIVAFVKLQKGGTSDGIRPWLEAGIALLAVGLFVGPLADLVAQAWLKLSQLIGNVMSRVLLSLVFVLILLPVALLYRLLARKDNLGLKRKGNGCSYYTAEERPYLPQDLQNPW